MLVEAGESYEELRGVSLECDVELLDDVADVAAIGTELLGRYAGDPDAGVAAAEFVEQQARKRVGLVFTPTRVVSWDHAKLGGGY